MIELLGRRWNHCKGVSLHEVDLVIDCPSEVITCVQPLGCFCSNRRVSRILLECCDQHSPPCRVCKSFKVDIPPNTHLFVGHWMRCWISQTAAALLILLLARSTESELTSIVQQCISKFTLPFIVTLMHTKLQTWVWRCSETTCERRERWSWSRRKPFRGPNWRTNRCFHF